MPAQASGDPYPGVSKYRQPTHEQNQGTLGKEGVMAVGQATNTYPIVDAQKMLSQYMNAWIAEFKQQVATFQKKDKVEKVIRDTEVVQNRSRVTQTFKGDLRGSTWPDHLTQSLTQN